jgi:glycosyltransferase involved in cell wall biosynthesis
MAMDMTDHYIDHSQELHSRDGLGRPPMNIAFMITPTAFGGAEKVGLTLLKHIDSQRYHFQLIALVRPWEKHNPFVEAVQDAGWPVHTIPVAMRPRDQGRDYFRVLRCFRHCRALLKKLPIDMVHTNGYFANLIGIPASMSLGLAAVSTCHGFIDGDRKLRLYNWLDKKVLHRADRVVAVSRDIGEQLKAGGIRTKRIQVIPNAVPTPLRSARQDERRRLRKRFQIPDNELVLGYMGRLSEEKGLPYLIEAVRQLSADKLPVRLLLVGDGPQRNALERRVEQSGLQSRCTFTGFQQQAERLLPAIDIFVLPSLTEGTPMALLEAMAAGVPVIASAVGGIPGVLVSRQNGLLVAPGQPADLCMAIKTLCSDDAIGQGLANAAKQTITERFGIEPWIRRYETLYADMARKKRILGAA